MGQDDNHPKRTKYIEPEINKQCELLLTADKYFGECAEEVFRPYLDKGEMREKITADSQILPSIISDKNS